VTGTKTLISQGGLLSPAHKTVAVAIALDGDIIAVHRMAGLIRVNPDEDPFEGGNLGTD
jgi:hypothetical protein